MEKKFLNSVLVIFLFFGTNGVLAQFIPVKVGQICLENTEQFS